MTWTSWILLPLAFSSAQQRSEQGVTREMVKRAPDGHTVGWVRSIPWPDQEDESQRWRRIGTDVVIARDGKVVRRFSGVTIWDWDFWNGGREIVYEAGPVHGETGCFRMSISTGKLLEEWPGDCRHLPDNAPAWVKAASGMSPR